MSELYYTIVAEAPLALNERKPGGSQYQEGLNYIPGRVMRGALAALVLPTCQDPFGVHEHQTCPEPAICHALFNEQMLFRDAQPAGSSQEIPHLLPATAFSCKDNKGFWPKGHGVFDTLIDRAGYEIHQPVNMQYLPSCPHCGGRTTGYGGVYAIHPEKTEANTNGEQQPQSIYYPYSVAKELLTRVAINRRRGVAEDELLYAINALSQYMLDPTKKADCTPKAERLLPATYVGAIWLPDEGLRASAEDLLQRIHRIGSGGSRGLGRVKVQKMDVAPTQTVEARLDQFNQIFQKRATLMDVAQVDTASSPFTYFTVTLQSDAILQEDWSPTMQLSPTELWSACGEQAPPPDDLELLRSYTTPTTRGGWNAIWGLRKETAQVVQAGAVYLFRVTAQGDWNTRLAHLETVGIGLRRAEGFGQVRICDEFHYRGVGKGV